MCRHLCTRGSTEELVLSLWIFMEALGIICKLSLLSCKRLITPSHLASPHSLFTISKTLNSWNSPGKIMTSAYLTEKHPIPMFTFFAGQWPALLANTSFLWNSSSEIYKGEEDLPEQVVAVSHVSTPETKSRAVSQSADFQWGKEVRAAP